MLIGKVKPRYVYQSSLKYFITSDCRSLAVVCVSSSEKYPRSGYFIVDNSIIINSSRDDFLRKDHIVVDITIYLTKSPARSGGVQSRGGRGICLWAEEGSLDLI